MNRLTRETSPAPVTKVAIYLSLSIVMATTSQLALGGAVREEDPDPLLPPRWASWGSLADNSVPLRDMRGIYDWELAQMIADTIGTSADMIVLNTACYGGDFLDNLNSSPDDDLGGEDWFTFANSTVISGNLPGRVTIYGGFHRGAAQNLVPGATTSDVFGAPNHPFELPQMQGPDKAIGGANSTHVLVWAGHPNDQDREDIADIISNFNPAQHPTATVTVLAGNDAAGTTDNVTTGPATRTALGQALGTVQNVMGPGEQFILVVTDHGDYHRAADLAVVAPPHASTTIEVPFETEVLGAMLLDSENVPAFTLGSSAPFPHPDLITVTLQSANPWTVSLSNPDIVVGTLVAPNGTQIVTYTIPLLDENFAFNHESQFSSQLFFIENDSNASLSLAYAELGSGEIARQVPEPTGGALVMLGSCSLWAAFRARGLEKRKLADR